jgi:hypothetical protein
MKYIVLFQHSCGACSKVGKLVTGLSIAGLEARPLTDPKVAELLSSAGLQTPDRPSLLVAGDEQVQVLSGWAMRKCLAGVVGWRRSGRIVQLLAAEWQARLARAAESGGPSRRKLLGGSLAGLAGIAGWIMMPGAASASSSPSDGEPSLRPVNRADADKALATPAVRRAVRTWGPVDADVYELSRNGESTLALLHPRHQIITLVDNSPAAVRSGRPAGLSIGKVEGADHELRYYTVGGTPLADLNVKDGRGTVRAAPRDATVPGSNVEVEPDFSKAQIACWIECVNRRIKGNVTTCVNNCAMCLTQVAINPNWGAVPTCIYCIYCAGAAGLRCLPECAIPGD